MHQDRPTSEQLLYLHATERQRPVNGTLELLPLCNMNCAMCYIRRSRAEVEALGGLRPAEDWIALGEEMARAGVLFLLLTGGEPLLFPGFRDLYLSLRSHGMVLTLNTNGTLIDGDWADFFSRYPPRRVNITLYGADEAAYERLCRYPGGFSRTMEGIRRLRAGGVAVKLNGSVTRENRADMAAIYRLGRELDVPVHMDTYMLPGLHERALPFSEQARLAPEDAARAELEMLRAELEPEALRHHVRTVLAQVGQTETLWPGQITCMAGNCSFAIGWRGEMRPCITFDQPAVPVFETGFEAAWAEISRAAKALPLHGDCTRCPLRPACKSCPASAYLETGRYDGKPEYLCRYTAALVSLLQAEAGRL